MCYRLAEAARSRRAHTEDGPGLHAPRESNVMKRCMLQGPITPTCRRVIRTAALVCGRGCTLSSRLSKCFISRRSEDECHGRGRLSGPQIVAASRHRAPESAEAAPPRAARSLNGASAGTPSSYAMFSDIFVRHVSTTPSSSRSNGRLPKTMAADGCGMPIHLRSALSGPPATGRAPPTHQSSCQRDLWRLCWAAFFMPLERPRVPPSCVVACPIGGVMQHPPIVPQYSGEAGSLEGPRHRHVERRHGQPVRPSLLAGNVLANGWAL